jgi:hypothetical protein
MRAEADLCGIQRCDLAGRLVKDEIVHHVYAVEAGLITSMEIETRP